MTEGEKHARDLYTLYREVLVAHVEWQGPAPPSWDDLPQVMRDAWYATWLLAEDICINEVRAGNLR